MCARYLGDQNKVVLLHESGTYAVASGNGLWPGQVSENSINDEENMIVDRFLGTTSRSFSTADLGPRNVTGTLTLYPQDARLLFQGIGSVYDTSGTTSIHTVTQIDTNARQSAFTSGTLNPPFSFTIEDSKQAPGTGKNFIRTINGCVADSVNFTVTQGEKANMTIDYIGQTISFSSGTTTSMTQMTNRPYTWSDLTLTVAGSVINTAKEAGFQISQNVESPHYLNGSRDISVPYPGNRDYTLSITADLDADNGNLLYEDLYKNNGSFNCTFDLNADGKAGTTGSQHVVLYLSGCRIVNPPTIPSPAEGTNEVTFEIMPQNINGQSWDSVGAVSKYNPW